MPNKLRQLAQKLTEESQLKDLIPWNTIHKYLPFAIRKEQGRTRTHIVNDSIYTIETLRGEIEPDMTLCRKTSPTSRAAYQFPICTGCLEIARGLAMKHVNE